MEMKRISLDQGVYNMSVSSFLAFAAHVEGKKPGMSFPKLDSIGLAVQLILSGLKNTGRYKAADIEKQLVDISKHFAQPEGPKR